MPLSRKAIRRLAHTTMVAALSTGFTACGGEIVLGDQTPPPSRTETIAEVKKQIPQIRWLPGEEELNSDRLIGVCNQLMGLLNIHGAADPPVLTERELQLLTDGVDNCNLFPDDARRTLRRLVSEMERRDAAE